MLWPREAGKFIAENARDVKICPEGIQKTAEKMSNFVRNGKISFKKDQSLPYGSGLSQKQLTDLVFFIDSINFNFWTPNGKPKFSIKYKQQEQRGYLAMMRAINRAIEEGKPIYDPSYYSKLKLDELKEIFRSENNVEIPMLSERSNILCEVGNILVDKFDGSFLYVLKNANGSALKLVSLVLNEFPSFKDVHTFNGKTVGILKRAQILAADIWLLYEGKGVGYFHDIDELTMFADYRVPQSLVHFGALSYSDELYEKLQRDYLFKSGDRQEVEIRGTSIHAIELIVEETNKLLANKNIHERTNSIQLDFFMWGYRVKNAKLLENIPYHKVRTTFY